MAKYDPLIDHLRSVGSGRVRLTFAELEAVLGSPLPASARDHAAWWANETAPRTYVHKIAWHEAGYEIADVDRTAGWVIFRKVGSVDDRT